MSDFNIAVAMVLHHEGGYVDNHADKGGPTNFGITLGLYRDWLGDQNATAARLKALSESDAEEIYKKFFWDVDNFNAIGSDIVATVLFDQAILDGTAAIKRIQALIGVQQDGQLGPMTTNAINMEHAESLAFKFIRASVHYYTGVCTRDASQLRFLSGWIDRLMSLLDYTFLGEFA